MNQHNIIKKVNDILKDETECSFAIITEDGYPHVSTRSFCKPANIIGGYISSDTSGNLVQALLKNDRASLCVRHENNNITLIGKVKIVTDKKIKQELWLDWFIDHYKGGVDDPEFTVIEFVTELVSLYVDREIAKFDMDFMQPVSCCGLLCKTCSFAQSHNCKGCIATKGNPFYGECHIAKCVIEKGLVHCGQCTDMPCAELNDYSCGDGEHCDNPKGARLEILRMWNGLKEE